MENWGLLLMDEDRFLFNEVGCWPAPAAVYPCQGP